jgi:hypothetical protein
MRRLTVCICALACAAFTPTAALAAASPATHGSVTGTITYSGYSTLTIQSGGKSVGMINALSRAATALGARNYAYVYGGGHAQAGIASIGIKGPGYNGRRVGYDCSGSVAAVLAAAGLWPPGSGVPNDAGVIAQLMAQHLIARGAGIAPGEVTFYDDPGVHIFMNVDGRFFGTSDGGGGGNAKGGPSWLYDGAPDARSSHFKRYHLVASVLKDRTTYGHSFTFDTTALYSQLGDAELGEKVKVSYSETRTGSLTATAIQYVGTHTAGGTVTAIAGDGSSLTLQTAGGKTLTFATAPGSGLLDGVLIGDGVQVTYSSAAAGELVGHALKIVSVPVTTPPVGTTPPTSTTPTPIDPTSTTPASYPANGYGTGRSGTGYTHRH